MKLSGIVILLCILCNFMAYSASMEEADSAYMNGNYEKALSIYEEVASEQGVSAALLYNMGNSYFETDNYGKAMLCYQRARRLDPSSSLINSNLRYLEEKVKDINRGELGGKRLRLDEDEPTFFQSIHNKIAKDVSSNLWAVWGGISFILMVVCCLAYMFMESVIIRKIGFFGALSFLSICIILMICAFTSAYAYSQSDEGIITAYKVALQNDPGETSGHEQGVLSRGTKVRIIAEEADAEGNVTWYKIRLNSDFVGWVNASDLEII